MQKEADLKEISLNVLVNQLFRRYIEWDRYESKLGMMPVPKAMLISCLDRTMELAREAGIKGIESNRDQIARESAEIAFKLMKDSVTVYEEKI